MRTVLPFESLAEASNAALKRLGFKFYLNQTTTVREFEVYEPAKFLVRIEDMDDRRLGPAPFFGFFGGGSGGRSISMIGISDHPEDKASLSTFVNELLAVLPSKPWEGLGLVERRVAKAYWLAFRQDVTGSALKGDVQSQRESPS